MLSFFQKLVIPTRGTRLEVTRAPPGPARGRPALPERFVGTSSADRRPTSGAHVLIRSFEVCACNRKYDPKGRGLCLQQANHPRTSFDTKIFASSQKLAEHDASQRRAFAALP